MTLEELKQMEREITREADERINQLRVDYSLEHNPYSVGDIIRDHYHIIKVEKISVYSVGNCVYTGVELKKDLTPKKRQVDTNMYQSYVEEKLT
jgi:hypothetical protein